MTDSTKELLEKLTEEVEYLTWMWTHAEFGPGEGDYVDELQRKFMSTHNKLPPDGWAYDSTGEKITELPTD